MSGDTISIKIKLEDGRLFAKDVKEASVEIDGLGNSAARAEKKSRSSADGFNFLQKALGLLKPATLVVGLGLLAQTLSALTSGLIGLVSAIAPTAGLLAALPAAALIAGQGMGVLKLAFLGVMGAVGGLNSSMDLTKFAALQRPAQDFALALNGLKAPIIAIQQRIQAGLFPGLTKGLNAAKPALAALAGPLAQTGTIFGNLGRRLGELVGSKGFLADLHSQAQFNNVQISRLGDAGLHLVDALRQLVVGARPLVSWLVQLADGWARTADSTLTAWRYSGKLTSLFHTVQVTAGKVGTILWNVADALFHIGSASRNSLGTSLLDSLVKGAKALNAWSQSSKGIRDITHFFSEAEPVVYAVVKLVGSLLLGFLKLGAGGSPLAKMFTQVQTQFLPVLVKLLSTITRVFGPPLLRLLSAAGRALAALFGVFGKSNGPAVIFLNLMTALLNDFTALATTVPGGKAVIIAFIAAFAGWKVIKWTSDAIGGVEKSFTDVVKNFGKFKTWLLGASVTTGAEAGEAGGAAEATGWLGARVLAKFKAAWTVLKTWLVGASAAGGAEAGTAAAVAEAAAMADNPILAGVWLRPAAAELEVAGATLGGVMGTALVGALGVVILAYFGAKLLAILVKKANDVFGDDHVASRKKGQVGYGAVNLPEAHSNSLLKMAHAKGLPIATRTGVVGAPKHQAASRGFANDMVSVPGVTSSAAVVPNVSAPRVSKIPLTGDGATGAAAWITNGGGAGFATTPDTRVFLTSQTNIDGQKVAENTSEVVAKHKALS